MKKGNNLKNYPFLAAIIISTICLTLIGFIRRNNLYSDYEYNVIKVPMLSFVFEGISAGKYPWAIPIKKSHREKEHKKQQSDKVEGKEKDSKEVAIIQKETKDFEKKKAGKNEVQKNETGKNDSGKNEARKNETAKNEGKKVTENVKVGENNLDKKEAKKDQTVKVEKNKSKQEETSNKPEKKMLAAKLPEEVSEINSGEKKSDEKKSEEINSKDINSKDINSKDINSEEINSVDQKDNNAKENKVLGKEAKFKKVKKSYFNDALFIGDSRTVGLSEYSGWKKPTFYADIGLTIYDVFDKKIVKSNGKMITIEAALKRNHFKKVYIMLGINELGRGTTKTFIKEYKKVISRIKKLQPDAVIYVEGIIKVTKKKSDTDPIFNNKNITDKNNHLCKLADNKKIFYIDANEAITDKSGNLRADYTFDSIHLKATYYRLWTNFLLKHGV